jgi:transcriptional repressor NrdR
MEQVDERRQEFNKDKLLSQIVLACNKRPIPYRDIEKVVEDIEAQVQGLGKPEIKSSTIGEMVMERLKSLDRIAYIRWASVYRDFQDMESFEEMVKDLREDSINTEEENMTLFAKKIS